MIRLLLFSIVALAGFFELNAEFALTNTMEKFINRFRYIENSAFAQGKQLSQMTLGEMDQMWRLCKEQESES